MSCLLGNTTGSLFGLIAVGTFTPSCRRTTASRVLLIPSTRVRAGSDCGHLQRAENSSGNSGHLCTTARQLTSLAWSQVGVISLQALNHFQRYAYVRQATLGNVAQKRAERAPITSFRRRRLPRVRRPTGVRSVWAHFNSFAILFFSIPPGRDP
jgi:hypothetical protein